MAQKIIQGIDDKTLILSSIAREEDRQNPQFIAKKPESIISSKPSLDKASYKQIAPDKESSKVLG